MEDSDLKNQAPRLFSLAKKSVYHVPKYFFSEMDADIRRQCNTRKKNTLKKIRKWTEITVAAAIVVLVIFSSIKTLLDKQYLPVETIRDIHTIEDGK